MSNQPNSENIIPAPEYGVLINSKPAWLKQLQASCNHTWGRWMYIEAYFDVRSCHCGKRQRRWHNAEDEI